MYGIPAPDSDIGCRKYYIKGIIFYAKLKVKTIINLLREIVNLLLINSTIIEESKLIGFML